MRRMIPVTQRLFPATEATPMFNRIFLPATFAGVLAALLLTIVQAIWVAPLILQAETYEDAARVEGHHGHPHESAWRPGNGWQRTLSTAASNSVMGLGFALILCGIYSLRQPSGAISGLRWGLMGYIVFFAAPAIGLPPDLPGTATAGLAARQIWWLGTAAATAGGLALIFLQSRKMLQAAGVLLLQVPHLVGAPQPVTPQSLAPDILQSQFRLTAIFTNAAFWAMLGLSSAMAFRHSSRQAGEC